MKVVVLTGGVGGAKLVLGLLHACPPGAVTAIVNTGDDFMHYGLAISPDLDTLLYTLSGKADATQGWGRAAESWNFMAALRSLGGENWFALGDGDLALHVLRSARLSAGEPLSRIIRDFARSWSINAMVLPMSDERVATVIESDAGMLDFQCYFVKRRCVPIVRSIRFEGVENAKPAPGVLKAIAGADVIVIAPSNPYLSIDPILAVPGIARALVNARAPVVAVSPIVGGEAIKGPTAKIMRELGKPVDGTSIARHYSRILDGLLLDTRDAAVDLRVPYHARVDTLMRTFNDRVRVAEAALSLAKAIA